MAQEKFTGEDLLKALGATAPVQVQQKDPSQLPLGELITRFPERKATGKDFFGADDLLSILESNRKNKVERLFDAVVGGAVDIGKDIIDLPGRTLRTTGVLLNAALIAGELSLDKLGIRKDTGFFQPTSTPQEAQNQLLTSAVDSLSFAAGLGLGKFAQSAALKSLTASSGRIGSLLGRFAPVAGRTAERFVRGAGVGFFPFFTPREGTIAKSGREEAGFFDSIQTVSTDFADRANQAALVGVFGTVAEPLAGAVGKLLNKPMSSTKFKTLIDTAVRGTIGRFINFSGLTKSQLVNNTIPIMSQRLAQTATIFETAVVNIFAGVEAKTGSRILEKTTRKAFTAATETEWKALNAVVGEELAVLKSISNQLVKKLTGGNTRAEILTAKREFAKRTGKKFKDVTVSDVAIEGFQLDTLKALQADADRLIDMFHGVSVRGGGRSLNTMTSMVRNLNAFAEQGINAANSLVGPSPVQTLRESLFNPFILMRTLLNKQTVPLDRSAKNTVLTIRNSLFGYLSAGVDSIGNGLQLGSDITTRGVGDITDLLMGHTVRATRSAAWINAIRNRGLMREFIGRKVAPLFIGGGERLSGFAKLSKTEKIFDAVLFGGLRGKGIVDTGARRLAGGIKLYDEAYIAARKRGLKGVERAFFVKDFVSNADRLPGLVQRRILDYANRAAFIVPRGNLATRVMDHPVMQLTISPFARFGVQWASFIGEFVPILGIPLTAKRSVAQGQIPINIITESISKQLVGFGAIDYMDRLYDDIEFTATGLIYTDRDTNEQTRMQSPFTDALVLNAVIRGDFDKAGMALGSSGLTFLGGGLMGRLPFFALDSSSANIKTFAFEISRVVENLFPGRAMIQLLNDHFGPNVVEEPFTEAGTFNPVAPLLPGIQGRPRIGRTGAFREANLPLAPWIQDLADFVNVDLSKVRVPRSLGSLVTKTDLDSVGRFSALVKRRTGRKIDLSKFPSSLTLRTRGGTGAQITTQELDERVKRYFILKKAESFTLFTTGAAEKPFFKQLPPKELDQWVNHYLTQSTESARIATEKYFEGKVSIVGELEE